MSWGADTRTKKYKQKEGWGAQTSKPKKPKGRNDSDSRHPDTDIIDGEVKYDWLGRVKK